MAYMVMEKGNGKPVLRGPYPNKRGEYCGNHFVGEMIYLQYNQTPKEAKRQQEDYLSTMRFGRPRPCRTGTTEKMEDDGYVGLYLKEDSLCALAKNQVEIPTPPELMEPKDDNS